ncbi:MAG: transposase [Nitrospinota bacterium]
MRFNPGAHRRRSVRLKGWDYSRPGGYFITICTWNRECLFGAVKDGEMRLNGLGRIVRDEWLKTPAIRPQVELDAFVVMPNHFHAILRITGTRRGVLQYAPTFRSPSQTAGAILRGFKSAATRRINALGNTSGLPLWQRNYYEHILRGEAEMDRAREYVLHNPLKWAEDENHPGNLKGRGQVG